MDRAEQMTEAEVMMLLRRRFREERGNGPAWALVEHVRNAAGFDARRTVDAIAMSLWPSRGLELCGFEIKCSRSDWLSELRDPAKAEAFMVYVDRWYLVAADASIVQDGELPPTWGLLVAQKSRLVTRVQAPKLNPQPVSRTFLAALLRQAGVEAARPPHEIQHAAQDGFRRGQESERMARDADMTLLQRRVESFEQREQAFLSALGADNGSITARLRGMARTQREDLALAVKAALDGQRDVDHLRGRIRRIGHDARTLAEQAERIEAEHALREPSA